MLRSIRRFLRSLIARPRKSRIIERSPPVISYPICDLDGKEVAVTSVLLDGSTITVPSGGFHKGGK